MNFIVDAQLPKSLSDFLNDAGYNSVHTSQLIDENRTSDTTILLIAEKEKRVVITKDYDFLQFHQVLGRPAQLILVKTGNIDNKTLLELFRKHLHILLDFLNKHHVIEMYSDELVVQ